jgi:hypothetical protein
MHQRKTADALASTGMSQRIPRIPDGRHDTADNGVLSPETVSPAVVFSNRQVLPRVVVPSAVCDTESIHMNVSTSVLQSHEGSSETRS